MTSIVDILTTFYNAIKTKFATKEDVKQPDYIQNDSTAADYIKNRPFYTGDPVEDVIIPATTVTFSEKSGFMAATWPENFDIVDGQTYKISWDGTDYVCTGILFNNIPIVGNLAFLGVGEDTGEPFIFVNQGKWAVFSTESATEHVISISEFAVEVVKINEKYLPESAFTNAEWTKISNKIVDCKQQSLSLSVSGEPITIRLGSSYSTNVINDNLKFEDGLVYKINGNITFFNTKGKNSCTLDVNGYYTCSKGRVIFGSLYDNFYRKYIEVELYSSSSDDNHHYYGRLGVFATIESTEYTFDINITVTAEAKPLPDICIGENIQRVGDDIILSSSTPNSTKKFKITVDDEGIITTVNESDSSSSYSVATKDYVDTLIGGIENGSY